MKPETATLKIQVKRERITFEDQLNRTGTLIYTNKGVSMMPLLRENRDIMVIEKIDGRDCRKLDAVLFRRLGVDGRDAYVLHRILKKLPDGNFWIVGDNCISGEIVSPEQILGILTDVIRDGKSVNFQKLSYRCYVRFWCAPYRMRFFILRVRNRIRRYGGAVKRRVRAVFSQEK